MPAELPLVSFGHIDSVFAFYYGQPIPSLSFPPTIADLPPEGDFCFCINTNDGRRPDLPFAWEELAVISTDRNHHAVPQRAVVVGRVKRSRID
jgi:hypothetical protein